MPSGTGMAEPALTATFSASPPKPVDASTRSPMLTPVTPSPSALTVPATSAPGEKGSGGLNWYMFWIIRTSGKLTAQACTSTTTCPAAGVGSSTSSNTSDSGGPNSLHRTAFTAGAGPAGPLGLQEGPMTEVSERYRRLADAFAAKIAAVPADRWSSPSPCAEWTARDVVRHVITTQGMFLGFVNRELVDIPSVDDDPAAAWDAARAVVLADLEDPERAAAEYEGFQGKSTFEAGVDRFLCFDLIVHGWDLARTAGLDERIDE